MIFCHNQFLICSFIYLFSFLPLSTPGFLLLHDAAPQHPHTVRVASISPELLTLQWPHDPSSCTAACSYLVRYQQTSPYNYNSYPVTELPVSCPGLLPAQPARSTSPNAMNACTEFLRDLIPGAQYDIDVYASSYNVLSVTAAQLRQRTRESLLNCF